MTLLDRARRELRIASNAFDAEIQDLLDAAALDLQQVNIRADAISDPDALVRRALLTYVKAHFGWDNPDHERLVNSYTGIKQHLRLSKEYSNAD